MKAPTQVPVAPPQQPQPVSSAPEAQSIPTASNQNAQLNSSVGVTELKNESEKPLVAPGGDFAPQP